MTLAQTNQQTPKRRKQKNKAQRIRTECKRKARDAKPQGKHRQNANHRQEILEFHSKEAKVRTRLKKKVISEKRSRKKQQWAQYAIYRETSPRKAKRPTTPSLKRHAAWEYPESAAHYKCLSWLPHPHSPHSPTRRKVDFGFKKPIIF